MAMRFDQIGSAQNVQQVGQGEAYVQDKYENPLLGVGKMTASLAQANRKAQIAAAKAQAATKSDLIKLDQSGEDDINDASKVMEEIQQTWNKSSDPAQQQKTASKVNIANNLLATSRNYQKNLNETIQKKSDLNSSNGEFAVSDEIFNNGLNSHLLASKNEASKYGSPLESFQAKLNYKNSVQPGQILNNSIIATDKYIGKLANDLGQVVTGTVGNLTPIPGGGYNEVDRRKISTVTKQKLDILVDNEFRDERVQRRYLDKLNKDPSYGEKYLYTDKKDGFVETGFTQDGKPVYLDKDSFVKDKLTTDLASKISQSDEKFKNFYQDYKVGNSGSGGLITTKDIQINPSNRMFTVGTVKGVQGGYEAGATGDVLIPLNPKGNAQLTISPTAGNTYRLQGIDGPEQTFKAGDEVLINEIFVGPKQKSGSGELRTGVVYTKDGSRIDEAVTLKNLEEYFRKNPNASQNLSRNINGYKINSSKKALLTTELEAAGDDPRARQRVLEKAGTQNWITPIVMHGSDPAAQSAMNRITNTNGDDDYVNKSGNNQVKVLDNLIKKAYNNVHSGGENKTVELTFAEKMALKKKKK